MLTSEKSYLLTYDPLQFHAYLETIIASNTTNAAGNVKQHQSPWLLTDAANIIFQLAKRRCYVMTTSKRAAPVADIAEDEDGWQALDEVESEGMSHKDKGKGKDVRPSWLPEGMEPVLEELPKWNLLAEVLREAEEEIIRQESLRKSITGNHYAFCIAKITHLHSFSRLETAGNNTILVMASSTRICSVVTEFLSAMDHDAPNGSKGRKMMMQKLRLYLWWKSRLAERKQDGLTHFAFPQVVGHASDGYNKIIEDEDRMEISEALKRKDRERAERAGSRRRVRGGAPASASVSKKKDETRELVMGGIQQEALGFAEL